MNYKKTTVDMHFLVVRDKNAILHTHSRSFELQASQLGSNNS